MKVKAIIRKTNSAKVCDCYVGEGYEKRKHGSLPDIDSDFDANRRDEVKAYLESRYNKQGLQRVFSAGTFTTEKIKSAIKDVARIYKISVATVNYLTAILEDNMTWTDFMKLAATDKRLRDFANKYPQVFEELLPIMGQARAAGIHASALIIVPEEVKGQKVECFDLLPIRRMGDLLVSEISGNEIDEIGILKNDVLGIKELTRLSDCLNLIEKEYGVKYTILEIASRYLNDEKVFDIVRKGYTQGIFQMSGDGITKFIKRMAPSNIDDMIASVALFRPGALDSGAAENYVRAKRGEYEPEYLWGTYDVLNTTFGQMCYQEQISQIAQKVGGLSLGDGVNLVKALSKKKIEKVRKFQTKFFDGAKKNGCPESTAKQLWSNVEDAAKYNFNRCIAGTEFLCGRHKGSRYRRSISIGDMWKAKNDYEWAVANNRLSLYEKYNRNGYGRAWSMNSENKLVLNDIVDIRYQGVKTLYRITLENGATLDVTDNHKHPTQRGIVRTDELIVGKDSMFISIGHKKEHTSYIYTDKGRKGLYTQLKKIVSICPIGEQEVYDVEMANPNHSFLTGNGVVTCNSHATAYGLTAYVGAWLKTHYSTAFYTVILRDQDEDRMAVLMNEIEAVGGTKLLQPDINVSGVDFTPDFKNNTIYWSLTRIKQLGPKAVQYIVKERKVFGEFDGLENFIKRIFKSKFKSYDDEGDEQTRERCPVTARSVRSLIMAGAFDKCENITAITQRYELMERAAELLGFAISEKEVPVDLRDKHYFWSQQQINIAGIGMVDYKQICNDYARGKSIARYPFIDFKHLGNLFYETKKGITCAIITSVTNKSYKDSRTGQTKHFGKIELQQNTETNILTIWEGWDELRSQFKNVEGRMVVAVVSVKWSDYDEKNVLQLFKNSFIELV